jgi:uncharacterized protein (DUF983 family)
MAEKRLIRTPILTLISAPAWCVDLFRLVLCLVVAGEYVELLYWRASAFATPNGAYLYACWAVIALAVVTAAGIYPRACSILMIVFVRIAASGNALFYEVDKEIPYWLVISVLAPMRPSMFLPRFIYSKLMRTREDFSAQLSERLPTTFILLVVSALTLDYFHAVIIKIRSQFWMQGVALWYSISQPVLTQIALPRVFHISAPFVFGNYVVLAYEALAFLLVLRPLNRVLAPIGVLLHAGIAMFLPLKYFGLIMLAPVLIFFPWIELAKLVGIYVPGQPHTIREPVWMRNLRILMLVLTWLSHPLVDDKALPVLAPVNRLVRLFTGAHTTGVYSDLAFTLEKPILQFWFVNSPTDRRRIPSFNDKGYSEVSDRIWKNIGFFARQNGCEGDAVVNYLRSFRDVCTSDRCQVRVMAKNPGMPLLPIGYTTIENVTQRPYVHYGDIYWHGNFDDLEVSLAPDLGTSNVVSALKVCNITARRIRQ